jgi:Dockerin type I domain
MYKKDLESGKRTIPKVGHRRTEWKGGRKTAVARRRSNSFRTGGIRALFDCLEARQLLTGDLTAQIENLLTNGVTGTVNLPDVSLGQFLTSADVVVSIQNVSHQGVDWSGSVTVNAGTASLAIGSIFSANILGDAAQSMGLTGSYTLNNQPLDQGAYSLSLGELDVTASNLLTGTAHEVSVTYSPSAAPGQQLARVGSLAASLTPFQNTSATLTNLDIFDNGFALEDGMVSTGDFTVGSVLAVTGPTVDFANIKYTAGSAPEGTIGLTVASASLFPGNTTFTAAVQGFSGTYDLATSHLALSAQEATLHLGKILDADATELALTYDPATSPQLSVSAGTTTLTSELFPHVTATVTDFTADANGVSIGDATLMSTPPDQTVDLGGVIEATGLSVELAGFHYRTNPTAGQPSFDGTVNVAATSVFGDGVVNNADVKLIKQSIATHGATLRGDVNGDGVVNAADLMLAKREKGHKISHPKHHS